MSYLKNTAGQKVNFLAINITTGLPVTVDAANITAKISLDSGAAASVSDTNPTELDSTNFPGVYVFDLTQAETNADVITIKATSTTASVEMDLTNIYTVDPATYKADVSALATAANLATVDSNVDAILVDTGTDLPALIADVPTVSEFNARTLASSSYATALSLGITDGKVSAILTDTSTTIPDQITALNDLNSTQVENAVWDAAYASHTTAGTFGKLMDLLRKANRAIDGEVSGTPTTTAFDTNLTGYTTGAFDSEVLVFVSGSLNGEARPILSFSATNGRVTFEEPWTAAPSASDEFVILPYHVHAVSEIASGIWSESQSSYMTAGTFGNYLDAKVSEAGGGYTDCPIVGRVIQDGTTEATVTEGEVIKGIVLD